MYREENQHKTDQLLIDKSIRWKMGETWKQLHQAKLIGDKKYRNLLRSSINENAMKGFVARQLVETSQMVKMAQALLEARYTDEGTKIVPVKASVSHNLREAAGLVKCREANDFHHAHDAYLACRLGLFIQTRHPGMYENPIGYSHVIKKYVREQSELFKKTHRMPGSAGFVVNSFMTAGFDPETGEVFDDAWTEDDEVKRYRGKYLPDGWNAAAEVEGIRRALNYRQCYISRMPYVDTGAYWNANPISKRKAPKIEIKKGLDPLLYGGYDSKSAAYFFIYEVRDKKTKPVLKMAMMPVYKMKELESDPVAFEDYCRELASGTSCVFTRIVIPRLLKWQLVEIAGSRLCVNAEEEMKSASQLAFSQEELLKISRVCREGFFDADTNLFVYRAVARSLEKSECPMLASDLGLEDKYETFSALGVAQQKDLLIKLIRLCVGNKKSVPIDIKALGGGKAAGRLRPARNKVPEGLVIIDQSVTGMFERRTRVGL